ncbi:MAG: carboxypeptidase regulatory-like domain-containing protein, partial [Acidobacteriales bacterium]|nr:carboxypeptidase regulatory-like domain-containing protein [Terriglobales bacterium]
MQRVRSHIFLICATSLLIGYGFGQDASTGALRGTVADSGGARIGSATVALVNNATGLRYSADTDASGRFVIELLPPGDYVARATSDGMSPQVTPKLHIEVNGTTELAFTLSVAGAQESVTVSGAPQLVETQ